jgi:L-lactate dehydrogenase complex protein LldE
MHGRVDGILRRSNPWMDYAMTGACIRTYRPPSSPRISALKDDSLPSHVGLFVTCLVDLFRPTVGLAAAKLLEDAGCTVEAPQAQTCCGQPAYNSGDRRTAQAIARQVVDLFEGFDHVVTPSGSCAGMLRVHYPALLADDPAYVTRAAALAAKSHELTSFLVDVLKLDKVRARFPAKVTYHDSCSGLRELGVKAQPRRLLASVEGLELRELPGAEICCGFGGTFCIKYPEISDRLVSEKSADIEATGAATLLAGDLGCLLNMAGKLGRRNATVKARHVAEVLAGMAEGPAIGEGREG